MKLEDFITQYRKFFNKATHVRQMDSDNDSIVMHPVEAVGIVERVKENAVKLQNLSSQKLLEISRELRKEARIKNSFFYYALAQFKKGKDMDSIVDEAEKEFNVFMEYSITKMHAVPHQKQTTIFFDWDNTVEVKSALRSGIKEFAEHYKRKKSGRKYSFVVTSASYSFKKGCRSWTERTKKHDSKEDKIKDLFDAIYCVPVIPNLVPGNTMFDIMNAGKLYTDICKKLKKHPSYSVIITDEVADRSVEKNFPIVTLVTSPNESAWHWQTCIDYLEKMGNGNILKGVKEMRNFPTSSSHGNIGEFRIDSKNTLFHVGGFDFCYFINQIPKNIMQRLK